MTTHDAAQKMIDAVRTGQRSLEFMVESLLIAEAKIAKGEALKPFTCEEMADVVALVKAELFPAPAVTSTAAAILEHIPAMDEVAMDEMDWAQCSVVAEVTLKSTPAQAADFLVSLPETHVVGTLTRTHPTSSYGQPVILDEDGQVLDYAAVESVHLLEVGTVARWHQRAQAARWTNPVGEGVPEVVWQQMVKALGPFGIKVTRLVGEEAL